MSAVFEYGWREDHARAGDRALESAESVLDALSGLDVLEGQSLVLMANLQALAAIAQAHYAAANIRTRPIRDVEFPG